METDPYLESVKKQFAYYKVLGEKAMEQLEPEQLFVSVNDDTNSIATIVKHLSGNMLSRWTDFLISDGEKEWRNRDGEFDSHFHGNDKGVIGNDRGVIENDNGVIWDDKKAKEELLKVWEEGWHCFQTTLNALTADQLHTIIYIRNEGHTVVEAINRQLAHYPYHVGQIVFYAKMLKKETWTSLSIPRNHSNNYNADKFSKEKSIKNFTDDELKKLE